MQLEQRYYQQNLDEKPFCHIKRAIQESQHRREGLAEEESPNRGARSTPSRTSWHSSKYLFLVEALNFQMQKKNTTQKHRQKYSLSTVKHWNRLESMERPVPCRTHQFWTRIIDVVSENPSIVFAIFFFDGFPDSSRSQLSMLVWPSFKSDACLVVWATLTPPCNPY